MTTKNKKAKVDVYEMVNERILAELAKGEIPWEKPWLELNGEESKYRGAFNRKSKKTYSLMNQMLLGIPGEWATYKQWQEEGGQVRKGEKSSIVTFWSFVKRKEFDEVKNEYVDVEIPCLKYFSVFHISQVDNVEPLEIPEEYKQPEVWENKIERNKEADKLVRNYVKRENIRLYEEYCNSAFYNGMSDSIQVPSIKQYERAEEFYSTLFHEMIHSTGHEKRLKRDLSGKFGSKNYAREELVAEIGSAYLLRKLGLDTDKTTRNNAAYIQSWQKKLTEDSKAFVISAGRSEKAVKFITE
jgi:antirestriction protein ArdC